MVVDDHHLQSGGAEAGEVLFDTARAATDWLFDACHPAPASAFSTWTAKIPNTRSTSSQAMSTRRKWVAAHLPSLANGLGRPAWVVAVGPPRLSPTGPARR